MKSVSRPTIATAYEGNLANSIHVAAPIPGPQPATTAMYFAMVMIVCIGGGRCKWGTGDLVPTRIVDAVAMPRQEIS